MLNAEEFIWLKLFAQNGMNSDSIQPLPHAVSLRSSLEPVRDRDLGDGTSSKFKGACLPITRWETDADCSVSNSQSPKSANSSASIRLTAIYDCPIRAWEVPRPGMVPTSEQEEYNTLYSTEPAPCVMVSILQDEWSLTIQTGTCNRRQSNQVAFTKCISHKKPLDWTGRTNVADFPDLQKTYTLFRFSLH